MQPYIDLLKEEQLAPLEPSKGGTQPFIDAIRRKGNPGEGVDSTGYSEAIREDLQEKEAGEERPSGSYSERLRRGMGPGRAQTGAIDAVLAGKSDLTMKRDLEGIKAAAGFRIGTVLSRDYEASGGIASRPFDEVYGGGWNLDVTVFYEFQPFHSEIFGNFGIFGSASFQHFKGTGVFSLDLPKPWAPAETFGSESRTRFDFVSFPALIGVNYRMNLFRVIRPFAMVAPSAIAYLERRSDRSSSHRGLSFGLHVSAGASIPLDGLSKSMTWDLYQDMGVKHTYLTVEYVRLTPISGDVSFLVSGIYSGLTFEF
ncbi:MAG: hypothetical protein IT285_11885 [Bdellovibrionales bacterium]|nr:hypothetical protein [Bdellovibrionales bacterium]